MSGRKEKVSLPAWLVYTISSFCIFISLMLILQGFLTRNLSLDIRARCTERIGGTVIKEEKKHKSYKGMASVRDAYTIELDENRPLGRTIMVGYGSPVYDKGDRVTVLYDPENADLEDETTWYLEKIPPDNGVGYFALGAQGIIAFGGIALVKHSEEKKKRFEDRIRSYPQGQ